MVCAYLTAAQPPRSVISCAAPRRRPPMTNLGRLLCACSVLLAAPALAQDDLSKWRYWKTIKIDTTASGAKVKGEVKNFPVPVVLSAANFDFAQAGKDGADLRF